MYFPYLRGKQYEFLTLREMSFIIRKSKKIIPIIEPVRDSLSSFFRATTHFNKVRMPYIIVSNPQVGDFARKKRDLIKALIEANVGGNKNSCVGFIISNRTKIEDLDKFFTRFKNRKLCLIHQSNFSDIDRLNIFLKKHTPVDYNIFLETKDFKTTRRYKRKLRKSKRVIIEDGFKRIRNEDYPEDEFFSELHLIYSEEGYYGFGDFLIVGEYFSATGGPAYAVAIHITYINDEEELWIKHFVSDTTGTPIDPAGKFLEALEKLINYLKHGDDEIFESMAIKEFKSLYERKHFPGLGYLKKLSMMHHVELILSEILAE